jgi:UDP-N-acetylmuramate: L-alanyl-gamma-D-glutamyl-meso-diaminopimelate ligase
MAHALAEHVLEGQRAPGRRRHARQDHHEHDGRVPPRRHGAAPRASSIGGLPKNFDESFKPPRREGRKLPLAGRAARRAPFVVEGDEYDTAFFEKTPKFWHYRPEVGDHHLDRTRSHRHLPGPETRISQAFQGFVERIPERGLIVASADDARVVEVVSAAPAEVAWYALEGQDTHGKPPALAGRARHRRRERAVLRSVRGRRVRGSPRASACPGTYNVRNALSALAASVRATGSPSTQRWGPCLDLPRRAAPTRPALRGLAACASTTTSRTTPRPSRRRCAALRAQHPKGALWAVFEPRSATACRALHQEAYAGAFGPRRTRVECSRPLGRRDIPVDERLDRDRIWQGDLGGAGAALGEASPAFVARHRRSRAPRPGNATPATPSPCSRTARSAASTRSCTLAIDEGTKTCLFQPMGGNPPPPNMKAKCPVKKKK